MDQQTSNPRTHHFPSGGTSSFNTTIAAAIADRLVEDPEIFLLGGPSVRKPQNSHPPAEKE